MFIDGKRFQLVSQLDDIFFLLCKTILQNSYVGVNKFKDVFNV